MQAFLVVGETMVGLLFFEGSTICIMYSHFFGEFKVLEGGSATDGVMASQCWQDGMPFDKW
jgi:hypothetical protein